MRRTASLTASVLFTLALTAAALQDAPVAAAVEREAPSLHIFGEVASWLGLSGWMLGGAAAVAALAALLIPRLRLSRSRWQARLVGERALLVFSAVAASGLICQAVKHVVGRARPRFFPEWGAFHFDGPGFRSGVDSFPSGHATAAFAGAVALSLLFPAWRRPLVALAILVCVARVLAGAHYPSDTVAGAFLGSMVALLLARSFAARGIAFRGTPGAIALRFGTSSGGLERAAP